MKRIGWAVSLIWVVGCGEPNPPTPSTPQAAFTEPVQVVPNPVFPPAVTTNRSNNNLDIADFEGRLFLVFRTAPSHFASTDTVLYLVSSTDQKRWDFEARFALGSDLREPRFFVWNNELYLYFAQLGQNPTAFEPGRMWRTQRLGLATWSTPVTVFEPDFIPWRIKYLAGRPLLIGYKGGENIYNLSGDPIEVYLLTTHDGLNWEPVNPKQPVVLWGGASETDIEIDASGTLYAVARNEAGDETGFGSKICRAPKSDITAWECKADPRKYDSPLLLKVKDEIFLIARRNISPTGHYDLNQRHLSWTEQYVKYQYDYWSRPKRCTVWWLHKTELQVEPLIDLPSRGDTCFPSALPRGDGQFLVYNYTSPLDGPDVSWIRGQYGPTLIYSTILSFATR